jgi:hypothetical protein
MNHHHLAYSIERFSSHCHHPHNIPAVLSSASPNTNTNTNTNTNITIAMFLATNTVVRSSGRLLASTCSRNTASASSRLVSRRTLSSETASSPPSPPLPPPPPPPKKEKSSQFVWQVGTAAAVVGAYFFGSWAINYATAVNEDGEFDTTTNDEPGK